ncbi:MAG: hypothetical protein J6R45_04430 [Clostridia bacterium]|nr:hypothetical protein [Clostridia bacterium]
MNPNVRPIIKRLIIYLSVTAIFAIAFQLYYGSKYTLGVIVVGVLASLLFSKSFLLPFANVKIEGTVIKTKVATYIYAQPARGAEGRRELRISTRIKTTQGRWFIKTFKFRGESDDLPVGTKIRFTIFDERPEIIKYPHFKQPTDEKY